MISLFVQLPIALDILYFNGNLRVSTIFNSLCFSGNLRVWVVVSRPEYEGDGLPEVRQSTLALGWVLCARADFTYLVEHKEEQEGERRSRRVGWCPPAAPAGSSRSPQRSGSQRGCPRQPGQQMRTDRTVLNYSLVRWGIPDSCRRRWRPRPRRADCRVGGAAWWLGVWQRRDGGLL